MTGRSARMLTMFAIVALVAAPAAADAIAGCAIPLVPRPDELIEEVWGPRDLVTFILENGVLELRGESGEVLAVQPVFALTSGEGRERLASGDGAPANNHKLAVVLEVIGETEKNLR